MGLDIVGVQWVSDKDSFRKAAEEKEASFCTQHSPCKSGVTFDIV